MARTQPLYVTKQVILDSNGNGQVSAGPTGFQETWTDITVSVKCLTNVNEAICSIYVGQSSTPQFFADGTTWGSTGDSSTNMPSPIVTGQQVFADWTGGDAGSTAYMRISGTDNVG
jgi:hypothetical protein